MHTGIFDQNSFQIDSINSCCTSKKLEFRLKIVKFIYFLTLKPKKGTLGFILEIMKNLLGGATSQKSQNEMTLPMCSNFSHLFQTVKVVCSL
jgi:hypothetical protein